MDRYPPKSILLAALGMFGTILSLMIAVGASMVVVRFITAGPPVSSSAPALAGGIAVVALVFLWLAWLSLRNVIRRIKDANQSALAGRAGWEAQFRTETERRAGSSTRR